MSEFFKIVENHLGLINRIQSLDMIENKMAFLHVFLTNSGMEGYGLELGAFKTHRGAL